MVSIAVLNNSGATILQGQVVRQTGFVQPQQLPSIALASAAAASTAVVLGIASEVIANNTIGQVTIAGSFGPIDTSVFIENAIVFLSDVPGAISTTPGTIESAIGNVEVVSVTGCIFITCVSTASCPSTGTGADGDQGVTGIQGVTGLGSGGGGADAQLHMSILGPLSAAGTLPRVNLGPELSGVAATFVDWRGRRRVPGSAGTTSIQLELNGVPVVGAILSWTSGDLAFSLKSVVIAVVVVVGDRLSFRLTSREAGDPRDIITEVNA